MTPEEQLIHDILVLEERKAHCPEWQEHEKLEQRQLKAVTEYAFTKAIEFMKWHNVNHRENLQLPDSYYNELYTKYIKQWKQKN